MPSQPEILGGCASKLVNKASKNRSRARLPSSDLSLGADARPHTNKRSAADFLTGSYNPASFNDGTFSYVNHKIVLLMFEIRQIIASCDGFEIIVRTEAPLTGTLTPGSTSPGSTRGWGRPHGAPSPIIRPI